MLLPAYEGIYYTRSQKCNHVLQIKKRAREHIVPHPAVGNPYLQNIYGCCSQVLYVNIKTDMVVLELNGPEVPIGSLQGSGLGLSAAFLRSLTTVNQRRVRLRRLLTSVPQSSRDRGRPYLVCRYVSIYLVHFIFILRSTDLAGGRRLSFQGSFRYQYIIHRTQSGRSSRSFNGYAALLTPRS